ncbi:ankyrin repeat domain protein [Fusarium sp. NRRL 25303]|nr:ankyrin repeat domain protein [Fusarium sp. NRRL 25303]
METAGLVIGVAGLAGLFTSCVEALDKIQSYRTFGTDSHVLNTRFKAARARFERWGPGVGIEQGRLKYAHHPALDDKAVSDAVAELLHIIVEAICDAGNVPPRRARGTGFDNKDSVERGRPTARNTMHESKTKKMSWALWGKGKRAEQVEIFEKLVQQLHNLVPPRTENNPWSAGNPNAGRTDTLTQGADPGHGWYDEIRRVLERIKEDIRAEARRQVLAWLSSCPPDERYHDSLQKKLPGTCDWILDCTEFSRWLAGGSTNRKLLWVNGHAGFGKTILSAHLVDHLSSTLNAPVAHFFFSSDHASREDPFLALRSWISQIVSQNDDAFEHARQSWISDVDLLATRVTIITLFKQLLRDIPGCILIADGLDECTSIAKFLRDVVDSVAGTETRVLLVSRDELAIRDALTDGTRETFDEYRITLEDVRPDINAYSHAIVSRKLYNKSDDVRSTLSEAMSDRCQGQFLWLKMQEECLRGGMNKKQLQRAIENTPTGLDRLYDHNWSKITKLGEEERDRAFALLRWAAFALRPLTVCEITEAALILTSGELSRDDFPDAVDDEYIKSEVIGLCGPLLEVRKGSPGSSPGRRTVHLPHFSVRQYLLCNLPTPGWIYNEKMLQTSQEKMQNTLLARACLQYICLPQIWQNMPDDSLSLGVSLREYAATTFHQHANSGLNDNEDLSKLLVQFFSRGNPVWNAWRALIENKTGPDAEAETIPPSPLYYAVRMNLMGVAINLINEQSVNEASSLGRTPLNIACADGSNDFVALLLSKGADFTTTDDDGWTPLNLASSKGHVEVVEILLEKGADFTTANNYGWTPLNSASSKGHVEVVEILLEKGADFAMANNYGWTPLNSASNSGHAEVVKILLERGADFTTANNYGWTPLHSASDSGYAEVVKMLLEKGADFATADDDGWTPLNSASDSGHAEVVKILLERGADFTTANNNGWTPLQSASSKGHVEVVEILLEKGADFTTASKNGWTPLNSASDSGHAEVVKILLEKGADFTTANNDGWTPLNSASSKGHVEVVEILLEKGADFAMANNYGWTPLNSASSKGHAGVVKMLLEKGADITTMDNDGWTPLNSASDSGHAEIVKMLLEKGADFTTASKNGWTPLNSASDSGHAEVVKILLEKGANVMTANDDGWTPLNSASSKGHAGVVKILLEEGADFTTASKNGWTPLNSASNGGHAEVVKVLLEKGADFTTANDYGVTPLSAASNGGHAEVVKVLLEKGADITTTDNDGWTPLLSASAEGHVDVVKFLLESSPLYTTETNSLGCTALFLASRNGRLPVVQYLLSTGRFDPNIKNYYGSTSLSAAVANGHYEVVELLISTGVSTLEQVHVGRSLQWWASHAGKPEIIKLLSCHVESRESVPQNEPTLAFDATSDWCDACTRSISSTSLHYFCQQCSNLALCGDCYERGFRCRDQAHALTADLGG